MPFNGSGVYAPSGADFPAVSGTLIQSSKYNNVINDVSSALSLVLVADGQRAASADLAMGGFKLTNVADATARNNFAAMGQVQDGAGIWCGTAGGTANALTLSPTPAITAYLAGQFFRFKSGAAANSAAATLAISGLGAKAIQLNGVALSGLTGEIAANTWYQALYDGTAFQLSQISLTWTVAANSTNHAYKAITTNTTLTWPTYNSGQLNLISAGPTVVTLPALSTMADGDYLDFKNVTGTSVTIIVQGADIMEGSVTTYRLPFMCGCRMQRLVAGTWIIMSRPTHNVGDLQWGAYSTAPDGWLKCGQNVSRTTYGGLFAVISTAFGIGDGSTTFTLPAHQGRTLIGAGTGSGLTARTLGQSAIGEETHAQTIAEMAAHTHAQDPTTATQAAGGTFGASGATDKIAGGTTQSRGSGTAFNVMQPSMVAELYIKA